MFCDNEYSSDTSDEDFVPQGAGSEDDCEDDDDDDLLSENDDENALPNKRSKGEKKPIKKASNKITKKPKRKNPLLSAIPDSAPMKLKENEVKEKQIEDTKKEDDLWADFLADVDEKPPASTKSKPTNSWSALLGNKHKSSPPTSTIGVQSIPKTKEEKVESNQAFTVKVTKVFEFAGEEVRIEEEVPADSVEAKTAAFKQIGKQSKSGAVKRPVGLTGLVSLLDNKKMKLSTLEKTKLDWNSFKSTEGLEEELEKHKKSKSGYLEKQAFLERADLREFEIERSMRMGKRSNR